MNRKSFSFYINAAIQLNTKREIKIISLSEEENRSSFFKMALDDFEKNGNEKNIDYLKMMKIVLDAGYHGYVGIEYEGSNLSEPEGIKATKLLLEKVREELSQL